MRLCSGRQAAVSCMDTVAVQRNVGFADICQPRRSDKFEYTPRIGGQNFLFVDGSTRPDIGAYFAGRRSEKSRWQALALRAQRMTAAPL